MSSCAGLEGEGGAGSIGKDLRKPRMGRAIGVFKWEGKAAGRWGRVKLESPSLYTRQLDVLIVHRPIESV